MARLTLRHRLARIHPFVWIGAVAVIAGLVAVPLGGWDTVQVQSFVIPDAAPGELVKGHQFSVEVESAEVTAVNPDGFSEPDAGWEYLVLTATITNETDRTESTVFIGGSGSSPFTIDDAALGWNSTAVDSNGYDASASTYLIADDNLNPDLQPGVPAPVILVWEIPVGTWAPGDPMSVGVVDRTKYSCTLEVGTCYGQPTVIANVPLTVTGATP